MRRREDWPRMTAAVILLVLQLGRVYLRLQWRRKRSTARFRRQLLRGGMSPEQARQLSDQYGSFASLRQILGQGRAGIPFLR
ncbi:MAG TPA: hypothetical protein VJ397_09980 [Thermoplasmata archaeon]|nr:hypothetical protein [Thermoplasmata archaeon]